MKYTRSEVEFKKRWNRKTDKRLYVALAVLLVVNLFIFGVATPLHAQTQRQNYNAVMRTGIGGSSLLLGLGGAACAVWTAGACGVLIGAGVGVMAITGTIGVMDDPGGDGTDNMHNSLPGDMPDSEVQNAEQDNNGPGGSGRENDEQDGWDYNMPW